jgi:hypothetical protein
MGRLLTALVLALGATVVAPAGVEAGTIGPPLPRPEADYRFQDSLASSIAGAPALRILSDIGASGFATEEVDGRNRRVLQFPEGNGLRLGNVTSLVARNKYTIAIKFRFDEVASYARVIAFKPDSSDWDDTGLYVQDTDLVWYDRRFPDLDNVNADQWVTVVVSRSANGVVRGYVGPEQVFSFNDFNSRAVIDANRIIRFFRDNENGEESSGAVARIRIWDEVLTADQVARLSAV